jgi:FlaA1/EpsC-like NDP-sugar epimerase
VLFLDDDPRKWNSRLHDVPVVGAPEILLNEAARWKLDKVIIAMPSAPGKRIQEVVNLTFATGPGATA